MSCGANGECYGNICCDEILLYADILPIMIYVVVWNMSVTMS